MHDAGPTLPVLSLALPDVVLVVVDCFAKTVSNKIHKLLRAKTIHCYNIS